MDIRDILNGMEDPYDKLNRIEHAVADLLRQRAEMFQHLAGLSHNQSNLVSMYDDLKNENQELNQKIQALEAVFREKI